MFTLKTESKPKMIVCTVLSKVGAEEIKIEDISGLLMALAQGSE